MVTTKKYLGKVDLVIRLPGMEEITIVPNFRVHSYTVLPDKDLPLSGEIALRIGIPDHLPRYGPLDSNRALQSVLSQASEIVNDSLDLSASVRSPAASVTTKRTGNTQTSQKTWTVGTKTETQTSVTSQVQESSKAGPGAIAFVSIAEESPDELARLAQEDLASKSTQVDDASSISQGSTIYSPEQIEDITARFCGAILRHLHSAGRYSSMDELAKQHLLERLRSALKEFSETVSTATSDATTLKAVKMIRRLRAGIAQEIRDSVAQRVPTEKRPKVESLVQLPSEQMSYTDKFSLWTSTETELRDDINIPEPYTDVMNNITLVETRCPDDMAFSAWLSPPTSTASHREMDVLHHDSETLYGKNVNADNILKNVTDQPAFERLVHATEDLFERYLGQKMESISRRVCLSLRRNTSSDQRVPRYRVIFHVGWDLKEFLEREYEIGIMQGVRNIATVTGTEDSAILCSVEEYFVTHWPFEPSLLLQSIETSLSESGVGNAPSRPIRKSGPDGCVEFDDALKTMTAEGPENFIVTISQQISWLCAACQPKQNRLAFSYLGFGDGAPTLDADAVFDIDAKLEVVSHQKSESCWHSLVGAAVVVTGFPIPDRANNERGLEISVPAMAAMSGTPRAVSFKGGYIFKGRSHALVPIRSLGASVQWHMVDVYPARLEWAQLNQTCPERLQGDIKAYYQLRSFVGWYPDVLEYLGTKDFHYEGVQYSAARRPGLQLQVKEFTIGFSQWGTGEITFAMGRSDGYKALRPTDYETLLDDARGLPVILHDTLQKRATQTNGEDVILHMLLHRQTLCSLESKSTQVETIEGAATNRRLRSTRAVMLSNAEKILDIRTKLGAPGTKVVLFKDEVQRLYDILDGLWSKSLPENSSSGGFKMSLRSRRRIEGWEYMTLVKHHNFQYLTPKSADLDSSCGRWHQYAKDLGALVLFAGNLGDMLKPTDQKSLCPRCMAIPKNDCFLTVRVDAIEDLYDRQGCPQERNRLTDNGWTLQGVEDPFKPCESTRASRKCDQKRVVSLVRHPPRGKCLFKHELPKHGAIVIGESSSRGLKKWMSTEQTQDDRVAARRAANFESPWVRSNFSPHKSVSNSKSHAARTPSRAQFIYSINTDLVQERSLM